MNPRVPGADLNHCYTCKRAFTRVCTKYVHYPTPVNWAYICGYCQERHLKAVSGGRRHKRRKHGSQAA
jgi:hypothetical protein